MTALQAGSWTGYHPLSGNEIEVFQVALKGFVGVHYEPLEVDSQLVHGINYRYLCNASRPGSSATWKAIVSIYAPLPNEGEPHITEIDKI